MKNPLTLAGIEPATFRFVSQHLKHCATAVPTTTGHKGKTDLLLCSKIRSFMINVCGLSHLVDARDLS